MNVRELKLSQASLAQKLIISGSSLGKTKLFGQFDSFLSCLTTYFFGNVLYTTQQRTSMWIWGNGSLTVREWGRGCLKDVLNQTQWSLVFNRKYSGAEVGNYGRSEPNLDGNLNEENGSYEKNSWNWPWGNLRSWDKCSLHTTC